MKRTTVRTGVLSVLVALLVASCFRDQPDDDAGFWQACGPTSECDRGYDCVCGRCTQGCAELDDCARLAWSGADCRRAFDVLACDVQTLICAPGFSETSTDETSSGPMSTSEQATSSIDEGGVDSGSLDASVIDAGDASVDSSPPDAAGTNGPGRGDEEIAPWPEPEPPIPACNEIAECTWSEPAALPGYEEGAHLVLGASGSGNVVLAILDDPFNAEGSLAVARKSDATWSEPTAIVPSGAGNQAISPCLSVNDSGAMIIAWLQASGDVYASRVWASVFDELDGWAVPMELGPGPGAIGAIGCCIDAFGAAMVAWNQYDGITSQFFVTHVTREGASTTEPAVGGAPFELSVAASGDAVLFWLQDEAGAPLAASHYTPGVGWGPEQSIAANIDTEIGELALALNADGNEGRAVWLERPPPGPSALWTRRFTSSGWGPPEQVSEAADGLGEFVVGVDAEGAALVVWQSVKPVDDLSWESSLLFKRYEPDLGWSGPEVLAVDGDQPALAMNQAGDFVSVWVTPYESNAGPDGQFVGVRSFISGVWSDPVALVAQSYHQPFRPAVTLSNSGEATIVWHDWSEPSDRGGVLWSQSR